MTPLCCPRWLGTHDRLHSGPLRMGQLNEKKNCANFVDLFLISGEMCCLRTFNGTPHRRFHGNVCRNFRRQIIFSCYIVGLKVKISRLYIFLNKWKFFKNVLQILFAQARQADPRLLSQNRRPNRQTNPRNNKFFFRMCSFCFKVNRFVAYLCFGASINCQYKY